MIHGDIDLTENLDFYYDKKSKEYKNSKDFCPPARRRCGDSELPTISSNISWNEFGTGLTVSPGISSTTTTISYNTYDNNYIVANEYPDDRRTVFNSINNINTFTTNLETVTTFSFNYDSWTDVTYINDEPYISYNHDTTNNVMSVNIVMPDGHRIKYNNIPVTEVEATKIPSKCDKLFGKKKPKDFNTHYDTMSYNGRTWIMRSHGPIFGEKSKKIYVNTSAFCHTKSKSRDTKWWWNNSLQFESLFGDKPEKEIPDGTPWLNHLLYRDSTSYRAYMEELRGNEADVDLSYLTNYSWLRMH